MRKFASIEQCRGKRCAWCARRPDRSRHVGGRAASRFRMRCGWAVRPISSSKTRMAPRHYIPPHFPMTADEARHIGEIVAMVVATSVTAAKDAAELVSVDYSASAGGDAFAQCGVARRDPRAVRFRNQCQSGRRGGRRCTRPMRHSPRQRMWCLQHLGAAHRRRHHGATRRDRQLRSDHRAIHPARGRRRRSASSA